MSRLAGSAAEASTAQEWRAVDALVAELAARGVRRIFGVPGGEGNLDVIEAASQRGIDYVVARSESSAAIMAAVHADVTGALGVVMTTKGPGVSNAVNGIAYAALDRIPLLFIADGFGESEGHVSYQRFDQSAVLKPLVKGSLRLEGPANASAIGPLLDLASRAPAGPVYLEVTRAGLCCGVERRRTPLLSPGTTCPSFADETVRAARSMVATASRPVILAGHQARERTAAQALRRLAKRWQCPVFTTYASKGAFPEEDRLSMMHYIGGPSEDAILGAADLILAFGMDVVDWPPTPWRHSAPVLELATYEPERPYLTPARSLIGNLRDAAEAIETAAHTSEWDIETLRTQMAATVDRVVGEQAKGISAQSVIDVVRQKSPSRCVVTVDSGAHMLLAMLLLRASEPREVLISKGLATMAFALPAAIGAALADPSRHVVALTGDGGLLMCLGELGTAVQYHCKLTVVVLNDSCLTLIGVKQRRRRMPARGVDLSSADFSVVAAGLGCYSSRVVNADDLPGAIERAIAHDGPSLVDVVVDPSTYHEQIKALRG